MTSLAVLSIHNYYQQVGGEDRVFATEASILHHEGHRVIKFEAHNDRISSGVLTGVSASWNQRSYQRIKSIAAQHRLDVAHVHNTFPLISPSAYYALRRQGVPIVQKLSNFRLVCPGSLLLRDGHACHECIDRNSVLPAIRHRCYRNSLPATAAVAAMLSVHRLAGTWREMVDIYIALSHFSRVKFIEGGLPKDRIVVKPNFVSPDPGAGGGDGGYALFAGRLSHEKGIDLLADAWQRMSDLPLRIAGDGPLASNAKLPVAARLGHQSRDNVMDLMKRAAVLVFPSVCYENCPMTILEALACGTPVIASNLGSMPEFVRHGYNGLLFTPGDAEDLARQVRWAFDHPEQLRAMRVNARREFEEKYTADRNYKMLIAIYEQAIENAKRRRAAN